jgi:hypothetical protein
MLHCKINRCVTVAGTGHAFPVTTPQSIRDSEPFAKGLHIQQAK